MKYLKLDSSVPTQEDAELFEFLKNLATEGGRALEPDKVLPKLKAMAQNPENNTNPTPENNDPYARFPKDPNKWWSLDVRVFDDKAAEAARRLCILAAKWVVAQYIYMFMIKKIDKYGAGLLNKNRHNERMIAAINAEVERHYKKHPNYLPCSVESFSRTSYWKRMCAKYRDKSAKDYAELFSYKALRIAVNRIAKKIWNSSFSILMVPPMRIIMAYLGVPFGDGTITNMALSLDEGKNTVGLGIDFKPSGFKITTLVIFNWTKDRRLIQTRLTPPPYNTYRLTTKDAKEIMRTYADGDLSDLKAEVKKRNEK